MEIPEIENYTSVMNAYSGTGEMIGVASLGTTAWEEPERQVFARAARRADTHFLEMGQGHLEQLKQLQQRRLEREIMANQQRRIVKVYVADPDPKLPMEKALLYKGEEHMTDLTDQELFFEVEIKEKLARHNEERVKVVDKEQSAKFGKEIFLEPTKIRELKMVVVNVANF